VVFDNGEKLGKAVPDG
jgi:hypothetical protein